MVVQICENCNKEFKNKSGLNRHLSNKKPCLKKVITSDEPHTILSTVDVEINPSRKLTVIDLFCGCGGMSKGLTDAGLHIVGGIDVWDTAIKSYGMNFEHHAICEDLTKFPPEKFNENYNKSNVEIDLLVGGPPCFIAGTKVLTYHGYKNIEDVVLEDKLLTHTGNFQNIVNLQRKVYNKELYEIKIKYHSDIIYCTEEHPFYIREKERIWDNKHRKYMNKFGLPLWKPASKLTKNDYFGMVINTSEIIPEFTIDKIINSSKTERITLKLDKLEYWYMMGYFMGDGWIEETTKKDGRTRNIIKFAINDRDEEEVCRRISNILPIKVQKCVSGMGKCKKFSCSDIFWFNIFKMFGKYAHGKKIPEWIQDAPIEFIQEFIDGYMKADGNIKPNGTFRITTVSYNLSLGLQRLYLKLGYIFGISKNKRPPTTVIEGRTVNQRPSYTIDGKKEKTIYSSFIEGNYAWFAPFEITKKEILEIEVYNFEVENDNSYIVENAIVHNCQGFSIAGKRNQNDPRNSLFMEYVKYLNFYNPKAFIMENVMGILSMKTENNESVIDIILSQLQRNYNCIVCKLYASDFEVPQNRRRIIIFGLRKNLNILPTEPEIINKTKNDRNPVKNVLLRREDVEASHYLSPKAITGIINKKQKSLLNKNGFGAQFLDMDKPSYTIPARYWKDGCDALVKYSDTEIRRLTIIELKRIQTFPDDYIILGSKKDIIMQIGNAVACRFAYHLGIHVIKTLHA